MHVKVVCNITRLLVVGINGRSSSVDSVYSVKSKKKGLCFFSVVKHEQWGWIWSQSRQVTNPIKCAVWTKHSNVQDGPIRLTMKVFKIYRCTCV